MHAWLRHDIEALSILVALCSPKAVARAMTLIWRQCNPHNCSHTYIGSELDHHDASLQTDTVLTIYTDSVESFILLYYTYMYHVSVPPDKWAGIWYHAVIVQELSDARTIPTQSNLLWICWRIFNKQCIECQRMSQQRPTAPFSVLSIPYGWMCESIQLINLPWCPRIMSPSWD